MRKLTAIAAIMCVSACSGSKHAQQPVPKSTTTAGGAGTSTTTGKTGAVPVPSPSTTAVVSSTHAIGDPLTVNGGSLTVFGYSAPATVNDKNAKTAPAGFMYAAIDVQFCAGPAGGASIGPAELALRLDSGVDQGPRVAVRDPAFLVQTLKGNQCNRGFVSYQIPAGAHATLVIDASTGGAWRVP